MDTKSDRIDVSDITIIELFKLIRNHEWDKFNDLLKSADLLDLNFRDLNENYLLTYAVRFNRADIVKTLLDHGAKYDIVDKMDRSVLYDAIESNYIEIIKILLEHSENAIGVMIVNIKDINGSIPLHYAIKNKNIDVVKLLIQYKSNPYMTDLDGYNALHLAAKSNSLPIIKSIISVMTDLNAKTFKGETALHITINFQYNELAKTLLEEGADPNIPDSENEFTALHYAIGWDNVEIVKQLIKYKVNVDQQDIYGNVALMYCIKEDYIDCFNIIIEKGFNANLWNIDGKILLHEVLDNYNSSEAKSNIKRYLDILVPKSNVSIQDSDGNTCLHHLIRHKLWLDYKDTLKTKKLNIFAKNSDGKMAIDFVDPKNYDTFIDIIVASYIYQLKKEKLKWTDEFDLICSRELGELTKEEKDSLNDKAKSKPNDSKEDECAYIIRAKILKNIESAKNGALQYCQRSYPINMTNCINIQEGLMLDVSTFTGSILDILIGLIYLLKKHRNACTTLNKNQNPDPEMCKFYKSMGLIMNNRCEFLNFEIVWIEYKLYMIDSFSDMFNRCIKSNARFIIIPLGIEMKSGSHANYLVYDKSIKEIERFEPHGGTTPIGFNYNSKMLDDILEKYMKSIDPQISYIRPVEFIPKIGFQIMDAQETNRHRIGDPGGFCALWSIWYVDYRLTYHNMSREELVTALFENIKINAISFRNMIRNYTRNITTERDKLLKMVNMDVNDWLNDNYTNLQLDQLMTLLAKEMNQCCN